MIDPPIVYGNANTRIIDNWATKVPKEYRDAIIEECARVSEERAADWRDLDSDKGACGEVLELECLDIAAAIRALKAKP